MFSEYFDLAVKSIVRKGLRSWLTMLGIFVGIAAVVSLISLGQGLQDALNQQFELLGTNLIYISPGGDIYSMMFSTTTAKLKDKDLETIRDTRGIELAGGMLMTTSRITYRGKSVFTYVAGMPTDDSQDLMFSGSGITISGRQSRFNPSDKKKAAIGYRYWIGDVFDHEVRDGDRIKIDGKDFEVVGEVSQIGNEMDDANIYVPYDDVKEILGLAENEYVVIMARVRAGDSVSETVERVKRELRKSRGLKEGNEDFAITTLEDMQESMNLVLGAVKWFLVGIAGISLFVGGVGIMNTMYTSVLERTTEIGVMKAVGAKNSDIRNLFLVESGILGMVGGVVGCAIGAGLSLTVEYFAGLNPATATLKASIPPELVLGAVAFSFIVGSLSGVLPAIQASNLKPVEALRYE
ncbi:MAG TPA: ABC transporter permease [Candidatus Altiarchaeales archaeon]|nr:ABC transporter permease [Candidatus Altiarchaeales archaeon]